MINVNARSVLNKIDELEQILLIHDPDVAVVTETWLHAGISDDEVIPPSYKVIRRDRGARGGGVALLIRKEIECTAFGEAQDNESVFCKIKINGIAVIIGAVYRPPNAPLSFMESIYDFLEKNVKGNEKVIIAGDFNLPGIHWDRLLPGSVNVKDSELLLEMAFNFNLRQVVTDITRQGQTTSSILDLILLSNVFSSYEVTLHDGLSDHKLVFIKCEFGHDEIPNKPVQKYVLDFEKADDVTILDYLEIALDGFDCSLPVNYLWEKFKETVKYCTSHYIPTKRINRKKNNPWVTREVLQLQRKLKRKRRKKPVKEAEILSLSSILKEKLHAAKTNFFSVRMTSFMKTAPQKFWSYLSPSKPSIPHLLVDNRDVLREGDIANEFNRFFHSVFESSANDVGEYTLEGSADGDVVGMDEVVISEEGIFSLLLDLDVKKSEGPDNIPNLFLKRYAEWVAKFLIVIFNASLQQHNVPNDWRRARVVPIYKAGTKNNVNNYRPISLTCTCCKLLEHVLSRCLYEYIERYNKLYKSQHGFRRKLSTVTQLSECAHDFLTGLNSGEQTDAVFLDLSKAFDRVSHAKLLGKLKRLGVDHTLLSWIESYLSRRSQFVDVNGFLSEDLGVSSGVPQGSVLGPVLFLIYINDITEGIDSSITMRLFADDCLIYTRINSLEDHVRLNEALKTIVNWCEKWNMTVNKEKTVLLRITNRKTKSLFTYNLGNSALVEVSSIKYLGVTMDSNMKWNLHLDKIYSSAQRKLGFLRRNFRYATVDAKLLAYKTLVRPLLEYGCVIWDPYQTNQIQRLEKIQKSAARYILNRFRRTESISQMMSELGLETLENRRKVARLKYIFMLQHNYFNTDPDVYISSFLPHSLRIHHNKMLKPYKSRTLQYQKSLFPRTVEEWNSLPKYVVESQNLLVFERNLKEFLRL